MAHPLSPSVPTERPSLSSLASSVHRAVVDDPVARVVFVSFDDAGETVDLGFWDVPDLPMHPIDPLVGFVAPESWHALGLISTGKLRSLDQPPAPPEATVSVVLLGRDGTTCSAVGPPARPVRIIHDPPAGIVPDILARALQLPTPPPESTTGALIDLTWLDRIASDLLQTHGRGRSWRWLADRHPLRGGGPPPSPEELAARVATYGQTRSWSHLRLLSSTQDLPAVRWGPPGGTTAPAPTWFDDGSLSRWLLRFLPPAEALVPDLLSVLPQPIGSDLLAALGEEWLPWAPADCG